MKWKFIFIAYALGLSVFSISDASPDSRGGGKGGGGAKPKLSVNPSDVEFLDQSVGSTSLSQTVLLKNTGKENVSITSIELRGTYADQFALDQNCLVSLSWRSSCSFGVKYQPTSVSGSLGHQAEVVVVTLPQSAGPGIIILSGKTLPTQNAWSWLSGSRHAWDSGEYGLVGQGTSHTRPSARAAAAGWSDGTGALLLFGGSDESGLLNDLWRYDTNQGVWTWVGGPSEPDGRGQYGVRGIASELNWPGARHFAVTWLASDGSLWLFGGQGYDKNGVSGYLNDLWVLNPTLLTWTWVSGSDAVNPEPVWGVKGVPDASNQPAPRTSAVGWASQSNELWLFGGSWGTGGFANDLWKFELSTSTWTWVGGSDERDAPANYGSRGVASASNVPGARNGSAAWISSEGLFWLFGGAFFDYSGAETRYLYSDLWSFDPALNQWTWVSGSNSGNPTPNYGIQGVSSADSLPPGRYNVSGWYATSENSHYIFGGSIVDGSRAANDLWRFSLDTMEWTWVKGSSEPGAYGEYGLLGVTDPSSTPGARSKPLYWPDQSESFWIFGGSGYAESDGGFLNDLWRYQP